MDSNSKVEDILKSAIVKVRNKLLPRGMNDTTTSPSQPFEQLYPMLDCWDSDRADPDVQKHTQFIYDYIEPIRGEMGHRDMIMKILTRLGPTPTGETRLNRVYKFCRLQSKSESIMREFELLQGELNALGNR